MKSLSISSKALVISCALVALLAKLYCAWTTVGTNDVLLHYMYGQYISEHDLALTYKHIELFNHTPLIGSYFALVFTIADLWHVSFPFLLRAPVILADFVVVLLLLQLAAKINKPRPWLLCLFALSPVSFMVSGYHGNVDEFMVLFLVFAAFMCVEDRPMLCGFFLALSCNIKIIPVLLSPIFFFYWFERRRTVSFSVVTAATCLAGWSYALIKCPALFLKNVFGYSSYWGIWGISYWLRETHLAAFEKISALGLGQFQNATALILKIIIIAMVIWLGWTRRKESGAALFSTLAYAWIVFFVFAPGACAQYMIWFAPFVLLLSPSLYIGLTLTSSLFLFFFYNTISHGMPWHHGISLNEITPLWVTWTNWPWAMFIFALAIACRQRFRGDLVALKISP